MVDPSLPRLVSGQSFLSTVSLWDASTVSGRHPDCTGEMNKIWPTDLGKPKGTQLLSGFQALRTPSPGPGSGEEIAMHKLGRKLELIELNRRYLGWLREEKIKEAGEAIEPV